MITPESTPKESAAVPGTSATRGGGARIRELLEKGGASLVGRKERFDGQLRQGHVHRRAEHRHRREQGKAALRQVELERDGKLIRTRLMRRVACKRNVAKHLLLKRDKPAIGRQLDLSLEPVHEVGRPFCEIDDPRRQPIGMER